MLTNISKKFYDSRSNIVGNAQHKLKISSFYLVKGNNFTNTESILGAQVNMLTNIYLKFHDCVKCFLSYLRHKLKIAIFY
jgi:hypothetical protein